MKTEASESFRSAKSHQNVSIKEDNQFDFLTCSHSLDFCIHAELLQSALNLKREEQFE